MSGGLLSNLVFALVGLGRIDDAEAVLLHAASRGEVRMRTFRPLFQHYFDQQVDEEKLWTLCRLMQSFSVGGRLSVDADVLAELLLRFSAEKCHTILEHHSASALWVNRSALEVLAAQLPRAELLPANALAASGELRCLPPAPAQVAFARTRIERSLSAETLAQLRHAARGATCVLDGANIGYRGAIFRNQASGSAARPTATEGNPFAEFFRHDQIAAAVGALQGHMPLILLPERYAWDAEGRPACELVERWLASEQLLVVPDSEPDDLAWMYATLLDSADEEGPALFAVTRDEVSNHRGRIWGTTQRAPLGFQSQRAFQRWRRSRVRWYTICWAGGDQLSEVETVIVDQTPPFSEELQRRGDTWYLPDESGGTWLRLKL